MFLVFGTICILNYEVTAEYVSVCIDDNGNTFKEGEFIIAFYKYIRWSWCTD